MSNVKKHVLIYIAIAVIALLVIGGIITNITANTNDPARLLSLGEKYLTELDYEQALVQFLKVIEIEPMNPRGYTGAAEAYVGLGRTDDAVAILEQGYEATGNDEIKNMLDEFGLGISDSPINRENSNGSNDDSEATQIMNLTGQESFSIKDLNEWGVPWGTTADALPEEFGVVSKLVEEARSKPYDSRSSYYITYGSSEHPDISAYPGTLWISSIRFTDEQSSSPGPGPRGITVGMTVNELMLLFAITNPDALAFSENPTIENFRRISEADSLEKNMTARIEIYDERVASDDGSYKGNSAEVMFASYFGHIDNEIVIHYRDGSTFSDIRCFCSGGIVTEIDVGYNYHVIQP